MTDAELAILSIVAEGPIYGYDIQTVVAQRGLRAWTNIGVSSMYYVLEKLERQGLLDSAGSPPTESPARRQFRLTTAGYGVLQTAVADLLSTPRERGNDFEVGLANLHVLRSAQIRTALTAYRQELISRLTQTRERRDQLRSGRTPFYVDAIFDHHEALLQAELEWIAQFIEDWEAQAPPDEPAPAPEPVDVPRMRQVILPHDPDSPHRAPTRAMHALPAALDPAGEAETDLSLHAASDLDTAMNLATPPHLARRAPERDQAAAPDAGSTPVSDIENEAAGSLSDDDLEQR